MVFVPDTRYRKIWVIMVDLYLIYKIIESMLRKLILEPKAFLVSTIFIFQRNRSTIHMLVQRISQV